MGTPIFISLEYKYLALTINKLRNEGTNKTQLFAKVLF